MTKELITKETQEERPAPVGGGNPCQLLLEALFQKNLWANVQLIVQNQKDMFIEGTVVGGVARNVEETLVEVENQLRGTGFYVQTLLCDMKSEYSVEKINQFLDQLSRESKFSKHDIDILRDVLDDKGPIEEKTQKDIQATINENEYIEGFGKKYIADNLSVTQDIQSQYSAKFFQQCQTRNKAAQKLVIASFIMGVGVLAPVYLLGAAAMWELKKIQEPIKMRQEKQDTTSSDDIFVGAYEYADPTPQPQPQPQPMLKSIEMFRQESSVRHLVMNRKTAIKYDFIKAKSFIQSRFFKFLGDPKKKAAKKQKLPFQQQMRSPVYSGF